MISLVRKSDIMFFFSDLPFAGGCLQIIGCFGFGVLFASISLCFSSIIETQLAPRIYFVNCQTCCTSTELSTSSHLAPFGLDSPNTDTSCGCCAVMAHLIAISKLTNLFALKLHHQLASVELLCSIVLAAGITGKLSHVD